jgi:lysophospholipase L1-like esterase
VKVVFFGDSITAGFKQLSNHKHIWNLGVGGDKTVDLIGRFLTLTRIEPDRLFIMVGTNDYLVKQRLWQDYIDIDYSVMIDALFTLVIDNLTNTEVFVLNVPPIGPIGNLDIIQSNKDIDRQNDILKVKTMQFGFTYLDLASKLKTDENQMNPNYTTDGVHFTAEGYNVYYQFIKDYILE